MGTSPLYELGPGGVTQMASGLSLHALRGSEAGEEGDRAARKAGEGWRAPRVTRELLNCQPEVREHNPTEREVWYVYTRYETKI